MAEINRFYRGSRGAYQSQFVPKSLPVDLMAKSLYGKQAKADQMLAASIKLGDWDQKALGWHDQEYVKGIKNELQDFIAQGMSEDRTSPEFQRRYMELTNRIKNDPNIKKVQAAVDNFAEYQDIIKKHRISNPDHADVLQADYEYKLNEYTKEGGKGFEGLALGDQNILKGVNEFKAGLEFFTPLKASGGDKVAFLGSGISYKNGWTGISEPRVKEQAEKQYNLFKDTRAGHQLWLKELQKEGLVETTFNQLEPEKRQAIQNKADQNMRNTFLDIGRSVVHGKSTTNIDTAYNAQRTEDLEDETVIAPTSERPYSKLTKSNAQTQVNELKEKENSLWKALWEDKQRIKNGLPAKYTEESKAQMRRQANIYKKQGNELGTLMNETFENIYSAQTEMHKPEIERLFKSQEYQWNQLRGLVDDQTFNDITKYISSRDTYLNPAAQHNVQVLRDTRKHLDENSEAYKVLGNIIHIEDKKTAYKDTIENKTRKLYAETENLTDSEKIATIQPSGVTVRTDDNSTMAAFNNMAVSNSETLTLRNSKGEPVTIDKYGPDAKLNKFVGNSVTSSGAAHHSGMSVDGIAQIIVRETDNVGNELYQADGVTPKYKTVNVAVNATLEGENAQFFKNNWAREQAEQADLKSRLGKHEEAKLARTHAMQLNNNSVQEDLNNFQAGDLTRLPVQVSAFNPDGTYAGQTSVMVTKVGDPAQGGGYTLRVGGVIETVQTVNEANARIQEITNSRISN